MVAANNAPVFVVFNPVAGTTDPETFRAMLAERFGAHGQAYELYETTGADDEQVAATVRAAVAKGVLLVAAAGGDGTVSDVATGLAHSATTMAILPVGTANVLAKDLGLPVDLGAALDLLLDGSATRTIDLMQVGERCFVLHISVGLTSLMHRDTSREAKRTFGRLAYMFTAVRWLFDYQPARFTLAVDNKQIKRKASMVVVANAGTLGVQPFRWSETTEPDDGRLDVVVVHARTLRDYIAFGWSALTRRHRYNQRVHVYPARQSISINVSPTLPVQGDGELLGDTPVQITLVPAALRIVVPTSSQADTPA